MLNEVKKLEEQVHDIQENHIRNTEAEESEIEEQINKLEYDVGSLKSMLPSLKYEESTLPEHLSAEMDAMKKINGDAEESKIEEQMKNFEYAVDSVKSMLPRYEQSTLLEHVSAEMNATKKINGGVRGSLEIINFYMNLNLLVYFNSLALNYVFYNITLDICKT